MSLKHKCHICLWLSLNLLLVFSTTTTPSQMTTTTTASSATTTIISSSPAAATTQTIDDTTNNDLTSVSQSKVIATDGPAFSTATATTTAGTTLPFSTTEVTPPATTVDNVVGIEKNPSNMDNTTTNEKTFDNDERHETDNVDNSNNRRTTPYLENIMKNINLDDNDNHMSNEISDDDISSKLQSNGLYRIKIGEITTDEFDNGLTSSSSALVSSVEGGEREKALAETVVDSTTMPATIPMHKTSAIEKVSSFIDRDRET
jgi:hypothetical protein